MQSELKPCPFCGCEKILDGYIRDGRKIVCGECRASVAAFHPDASKRAAERWNRRADDALSDAELQVCRERRYAFALPDDELAKDARELLTELDGFNGMEYDSDSEVACQRAHSIISALLERFETPAPSVAVKALADAYKAGFDASSQGYNGEVFPEYEADNEWLAQRDSDLSALSAQVQDVAGWQPIETAPKDGSTFLAVMAEAYSPRTTLCKFENGGFLSPSQGEKFVVPGWNQWWPTHWMPLPAAPAKQEN